MDREELLKRVTVDRNVCGGMPVVRGTRVPIAVILDSLADGSTAQEILDQYPYLTSEDVKATLAYAAVLAHENTWKFAV